MESRELSRKHKHMVKPKLNTVNAFINIIILACKNIKNGVIFMMRIKI
jgi:hypothetical protein